MINLIERIRPDDCLNCGGKRTIELYDIKDNPVRYSVLLNNNTELYLDKRKLKYFKCRKCGKIYNLDWMKKSYPVPLTGIKIDDFMREYNKK